MSTSGNPGGSLSFAVGSKPAQPMILKVGQATTRTSIDCREPRDER